MSRRDLTIKWAFFSVAALAFIALQQLLLNRLEVWGIHPYLLPMLPVMAVILEGQKESSFFAVGLGFFCDLLSPAIIPCFYTIAFLACSLLAGIIAGRVIMPGFLCAFVCGAMAMVVTDLLRMLFLTFYGNFSLSVSFTLMAKELLLSIAAAPVIFFVFQKISRLLHNE